MSFPEAVMLSVPPWLVILILASAVAKLSAEIRQLRAELKDPIDLTALAAPGPDSIVHDFHSEGDQYSSVTARAQKAWG